MAVIVTAQTTWENMCLVCRPHADLPSDLLYQPTHGPGRKAFWTEGPENITIYIEREPWLGFPASRVFQIRWQSRNGASLEVVRGPAEDSWKVRYKVEGDFPNVDCPVLLKKFFLLAVPATEDLDSLDCLPFIGTVERLRQTWEKDGTDYCPAYRISDFMRNTGATKKLAELTAHPHVR